MPTDLSHLPPAMRANLERAGREAAEKFENDAYDLEPVDELPAAEALSLLRWQRGRIERATKDAVIRARRDGASWRTIGESLGISAQAARQRFHKLAA